MIPCQTCSYSSHYHCIIGYPQMFTTSKPNDSIPIHNFSDCILIPKLQTFKSTISYSQLKQYEEVYDSIIGIKKDSTSTEESSLTTPTGKQLMYTPIVWQCPICKTEQCSIWTLSFNDSLLVLPNVRICFPKQSFSKPLIELNLSKQWVGIEQQGLYYLAFSKYIMSHDDDC